MKASALEIRMLGRFAVTHRGHPIPQEAWKRRRPVQVLTALALAPGFLLHREALIDLLWPEKDLDAGANNLHRTLHELRAKTGPDVVRVERGTIALHEETWTDVSAFENAIVRGGDEALTEALRLYEGELLPDDPYSDELQGRREGLKQRFLDGALQLANTLSNNGATDRDREIAILRRVLEVDPVQERAHRGLMIALARAERVKDANRQFAECVGILRKRLGVEPSAETVSVHNRIRRGELSEPAPLSEPAWDHIVARLAGANACPELRGRGPELEEVVRFSARDRGVCLIVGEAGGGKTRLSLEVARGCVDRGDVVLVGLGNEFEGAAPYTPFVDAWTDMLRVAGNGGGAHPFLGFQPTPGGSAQEDRLRLFQAVERALDGLAGSKTVCLILEDLHQADESSLQLFHHLARASRTLPIKLVGTLRSEEVRVGNPLHLLMASLGREQLGVRVNVGRLSKASAQRLVEDLGGAAVTEQQFEEIYRLSSGNAFYTQEIAQIVLDRGTVTDLGPGDDLMQTVRARVTRIGEDAERFLSAASVQGQRFDFEIARAAASWEPDRALDALDAAISAHVVEESAGAYRFHHALIREALYASVSRARRIHFHRLTAKCIEENQSRSEQAERLAHHYLEAGQQAAALPHVLEGIKNAQSRMGFGEAVAQCETAIELMTQLARPADDDRFQVLFERGAMRVALGDLDQAVADLDQAADLIDGNYRPAPKLRANARRVAALALIEAGRLAEAEAHLDEAIAEVGEQAEPELLNRIHYLYSQLRWHQGRHDQAFALAEKCLAEAEKIDDASAIARGYEMLALACHSLGEWRKGQDFEGKRRQASGTLDVASAFDIHL